MPQDPKTMRAVRAAVAAPSLPVVTLHPEPASVSDGSTAAFSASASGADNVQWQASTDSGASFSDIPDATAETYTTEPLSFADSGTQYRAVFSNASGSTATAAAVVTVQPAGLLATYPNAAAAYSLRSLTSAYTGPVVTVRRSSDSAEADFTATEVADGTLEAWCGAGDGLVKTLYDQSGHGRHASQSTATAQPKIVSGGVLVLENGLPAIEFDGTNDYLSIGTVGISGQQPRSFFWCANETGGITYGQGSDASGANWELYAGVLSRQLAVSFQNTNWSSSAYAQKVVSHFYTGGAITNASMYEDGVSLASTSTNGFATINTSDSNANIGYEGRGAGDYLVGTLQELIIYPVDQSANRVAIEDNINAHYNVFDPTVLLLHMDGTNGSTTFTDSSLNNFAVTANRDAQISTAQSKFGGASAAFDGTGDYLTSHSNGIANFGVSDFTIELWLYWSGSSTQYLLDTRSGSSSSGILLGLSGGVLTYRDNAAVQIEDTTAFPTGEWVHVAVCRASDGMRMFKNGTQVGSTYLSTVNLTDDRFLVGVNNFFTNYINGYIDDLRITKGRALYTANFTPPTQAHPDPVPADPYFNQVSLLLPMDGADGSNTFVDKSKNAFAVTPYGDASISTTESKFGGASAAFDGSGDYADVSGITLGSGEFTVEFWFYTTAQNQEQRILAQYAGLPVGRWLIHILNTNYIRFGQNGLTGTGTLTSLSPVSENTWTHVAVTRDSANAMRLFVDGVIQESGTTTGTFPSVNLRVGAFNHGTTLDEFNGYIDDLRITKGIARYTSTFTPPTAPHPHL